MGNTIGETWGVTQTATAGRPQPDSGFYKDELHIWDIQPGDKIKIWRDEKGYQYVQVNDSSPKKYPPTAKWKALMIESQKSMRLSDISIEIINNDQAVPVMLEVGQKTVDTAQIPQEIQPDKNVMDVVKDYNNLPVKPFIKMGDTKMIGIKGSF